MKILIGVILSLVLVACGTSRIQPSVSIELSAVTDFTRGIAPSLSFYHDKNRKVLAINAGAVELRNRYIQATHTLGVNFIAGSYQLHLSTMTEVDGESSYQVHVNGELVAQVVNPVTTKEFEAVEHQLNEVALKAGDVIAVSANAVTNGKIPEGNGTAYSRGRWQSLLLIPVK